MTSRLTSFVILIFSFAASGWADAQVQLAGEAEQRLRAGDSQGALALLSQASTQKSTAAGEDRVGFLYAATGRNDDAIAHFRKSIQNDSKYAPAHYHLGVILWLGKDQDHGLQELQSAVRLDPNGFDFRYRLGSAYIELGSNDKAAAEMKAAVALDATKAEAWQQLGVAEQRNKDLAGAVEALAKAVSLKPKDNELRDAYAQLLIATRQPERGITEAQTVLADNQWDLSARINLGYAYLNIGEYAQAEKAFRELLEIDSASIAGHYNLAIALKMQDQLEAAEKEFQKTIELDPSLAEPHYTLGITNWQLGDFPGTIAQMKAALAIRPGYAEAHYMLGIALKQSGDLDGAIPELKESIRLDPMTPGPYNTLGQILRIKGDKAGSEDAFAKGAKLKQDRDKQLANSLDQGMRGNMMPKPMTVTK
jgi:protein O-GlcNAc transferase